MKLVVMFLLMVIGIIAYKLKQCRGAAGFQRIQRYCRNIIYLEVFNILWTLFIFIYKPFPVIPNRDGTVILSLNFYLILTAGYVLCLAIGLLQEPKPENCSCTCRKFKEDGTKEIPPEKRLIYKLDAVLIFSLAIFCLNLWPFLLFDVREGGWAGALVATVFLAGLAIISRIEKQKPTSFQWQDRPWFMIGSGLAILFIWISNFFFPIPDFISVFIALAVTCMYTEMLKYTLGAAFIFSLCLSFMYPTYEYVEIKDDGKAVVMPVGGLKDCESCHQPEEE